MTWTRGSILKTFEVHEHIVCSLIFRIQRKRGIQNHHKTLVTSNITGVVDFPAHPCSLSFQKNSTTRQDGSFGEPSFP